MRRGDNMAGASPSKVSKAKNIKFVTTNTPRDQTIDPMSVGGNYAITRDGMIIEIAEAQDQATVTIIGGIDTFASEKQSRPYSFYITQRQKIAVYQILKQLAVTTDKGKISADNPLLERLVTSTYSNYCG
jgi:phosphopantothenoylcysteine synthetase/decarboxylase